MSPDDLQPVDPAVLASDPTLADWRYLAGKLHARFAAPGFSGGLALVAAIGAVAEAADHHPNIELRYPGIVDITLWTHFAGAVTPIDVRFARTVNAHAAHLGAVGRSSDCQVMSLALDTPDPDAIRPFWRAVLGLVPVSGDPEVLIDPAGRAPALYLQPTDAHDTPRQRFHVDIDVTPETIEARLAAALEAGGTLVSDEHAPAWWTLADPQGNQVDLCTWQDERRATTG